MISDVQNIDCMEFMKTLPDGFFDLAIADPPYGIDVNKMNLGATTRRTDKGDTKWDTAAPPQEFFDELRRVSKEQIIWGGNYFPLPLSDDWIIWYKENPPGLSFADAELAWCSIHKKVRVFKRRSQLPDYGDKIHITQKPVALYVWCLRNYAQPGMKIFDPMMGSQSSRIAAYKLGFDYWGCELDAGYFRKGCARFNEVCRGIVEVGGGATVQQMDLF